MVTGGRGRQSCPRRSSMVLLLDPSRRTPHRSCAGDGTAPAHEVGGRAVLGSAPMLLAIDQGTTGTSCLVFDLEGELVGRAYREFKQHFPRPGWVEHDAAEIWEVTHAVAGEALDDAGVEPGELAAVGITNQRETVCVWDPDTGEPLHRAIVWQDRRTAERCEELRQAGHESMVRERTGLVLDPYFSGTKIEWLL